MGLLAWSLMTGNIGCGGAGAGVDFPTAHSCRRKHVSPLLPKFTRGIALPGCQQVRRYRKCPHHNTRVVHWHNPRVLFSGQSAAACPDLSVCSVYFAFGRLYCLNWPPRFLCCTPSFCHLPIFKVPVFTMPLRRFSDSRKRTPHEHLQVTLQEFKKFYPGAGPVW